MSTLSIRLGLEGFPNDLQSYISSFEPGGLSNLSRSLYEDSRETTSEIFNLIKSDFYKFVSPSSEQYALLREKINRFDSSEDSSSDTEKAILSLEIIRFITQYWPKDYISVPYYATSAISEIDLPGFYHNYLNAKRARKEQSDAELIQVYLRLLDSIGLDPEYRAEIKQSWNETLEMANREFPNFRQREKVLASYIRDHIANFPRLILLDLNLSNLGLTEIPPEILELSINHLDLSNNRLTHLPENFGANFPLLRSLDLSHNQLRFLPSNFGIHWTFLYKIRLSYNQLTELPANFGSAWSLLSGEVLLDHNRFTSLENLNLQFEFFKLDVSSNFLTDLSDRILRLIKWNHQFKYDNNLFPSHKQVQIYILTSSSRSYYEAGCRLGSLCGDVLVRAVVSLLLSCAIVTILEGTLLAFFLGAIACAAMGLRLKAFYDKGNLEISIYERTYLLM